MATEPEDDAIDLDEDFECWCGEKGPYSEMCDSSVFGQGCGGTGMLHCECGGEFCVCHHHGEADCCGCEACEDLDDCFDDDDVDEVYG